MQISMATLVDVLGVAAGIEDWGGNPIRRNAVRGLGKSWRQRPEWLTPKKGNRILKRGNWIRREGRRIRRKEKRKKMMTETKTTGLRIKEHRRLVLPRLTLQLPKEPSRLRLQS
jgi:hypothetical protein